MDSFNETYIPYNQDATIIDLFRENVSRTPDKIAVVYEDKSYTYKEVDRISDNIAMYLCNKGIDHNDVVSILINRSEYMAIASLGVLKSGAAYQPLDSSYPEDRLNFMIKDSEAKMLIVEQGLISKISDWNGDKLYLDDIKGLKDVNNDDIKKLYTIKPKVDDLFILLYTSGSTGTPKGVMLEHKNIVAFCYWYHRYYKMDENSCSAAYASFGFDACMMDMYTALTAGARLFIIPENLRLDLIKLNEIFKEQKVTHSFMTTQVGRQFVQICDSPYLKHFSIGGETLVPIEPPKDFAFYNVYGPTECTIFTTVYPVTKKYRRIPIGKQLDNFKLYVIDEKMHRLPVGVPGELCVAGPQVSRGYLNRPEKTEETYIKNPFDTKKNYERIYRTGDVVRFLADGVIDFIGRNDAQVKVRGFRIELTEVEEVIRRFQGIKDATVIAIDGATGGKEIAAYIVSDEKIDIQKLNDFIKNEKPPYMVPSYTMQIDKIPLNQNHKVNKKELPKPEHKIVNRVMPTNDTQSKIYDILKNVLSHEEFDIKTSFEEAGLTSIASIRLIMELTKKFGVPVNTDDLKKYNTIESLDKYLTSIEKKELHENRDKYPLTQTQMGIYVECLRNPKSIQYNLPGAFALSKDIDIDKLKNGINEVIDAHKSMKCFIHEDEHGDIYMYPKTDIDFDIEVVDGTEEEWNNYFAHFARSFDMHKELPFRFALYKTKEHIYLVIDFHHIISDGSSIANFASELNRALLNEELEGEMFSQYDVSVIEEKKRSSDEYVKAKTFYDGIYNNNSANFSLKGDVQEEKETVGFYKIYDEYIDKKRVEEFCKNNKITENVFFNAIMGYVMGQYNHANDAIFTTIYNGRKDSRVMNTFGMLVKTLPIYCSYNKDLSVVEYMKNIKLQILNSMQNDIFSFAEISNAYHIKPEIMFVYQGDEFVEFEIGGEKTIFHEALSDKAKANISINIFVENNKYRYEFEYMSNLYSKEYIEHFYDIFIATVDSFLKEGKIGDISILSKKEKERIEKFNNTSFPVEIKSVNKLFEEWVLKIPNEIAVIASGEKLSYKELNENANRVANGLIKRGSKMNTLVGLVLDRDKNVYITRQGILKAGAGFLPLVPAYPDDRIDFCLRDANCQFVITTKAIKEERKDLFVNKPYEVITVEELLFDETNSKENPNLDIPISNIAYCLYTSGSTGKPKGVLIEHATLCNFVNSNEKNIEVKNYTKNGKVSLAFAAITFDVSIMEEYIPLTNGMTICMANEEEIHNPLSLAKLILDNNVDIMKCTPSFMMSIVDIKEMKEALSSIKAFDIGAEAFPNVLYDKMRSVNAKADIINSYGPTECTVSCTSKLLKDSKNVNIGGPLANMKLYVVNETNHSLPVGISGELIICGAGVGRGYMNLPEKTKVAFFTYDGLPAYHSGDLVKWNDDGEIIFLGRIDNQVKFHGLRIELDEIEKAISSFDGVKTCKVVVKEKANDEYLAAYYTGIVEIDKQKLVEHISSKLAHYMVPSALMQLDEMPLTNHGKIDKSKLPDIALTTKEKEYVEPETELEKEICEKYKEILSLDKVGATDSFFEIGGTSLSATKVVMYCDTKGYPVVYKDIFSNPTPRLLAKLICGSDHKEEHSTKTNTNTFDYKSIEDTISLNIYTPDMKIHRKKVKNVLLTGVTGFLGIHILKELLTLGVDKIYCLIRGGKTSCDKRLDMIYVYYFNCLLSESERKHIECIESDITDENLIDVFANQEFDVIINSAACVKHFVKDDILDRVNVKGVENLIKLALYKKAELIQISTTSVAGEGNSETVPATKMICENELYFGQILENDYIRTKFLAERAILSAVKNEGLKAKIMRCGNLMNRNIDGEFQINFSTNAFFRSLKAYKTFGQFPIGAMHRSVEFSPIDNTAKAIVTLMQCDEKYTIFHTYNSHRVFMSDVIHSMNNYGFKIDIVENDEFANTLRKAEKDESLSDAVLGMIAYDTSYGKEQYEIGANNHFTTEVLYRMNYIWPITDNEYLHKALEALDTLSFFKTP